MARKLRKPKPQINQKTVNAIALRQAEGKMMQRAANAYKGQRFNDRYMARQRTKQLRKSEYYKTKRSLQRSAAVASAISASEATREETKRQAQKEQTKRLEITAQYANLINGNQGSQNIVNPDDNSGTGSSDVWSATDIL